MLNTTFSRLPLYAWYLAHQVNEHSLQGPFSFDFATKVIYGKIEADFSNVEKLRTALTNDQTEITYKTFGKTSSLSRASRKRVASIAKHGISSRKKSALLYRIIRYFGYKKIVELGTSLGINTCYLAQASPTGRVITIEGHEEIAAIAAHNFRTTGISNAELIIGDIDTVLPKLLSRNDDVDFVFIDANHHSEALKRYFQVILPKINPSGALVVDDIRWSRNMWKGWKSLISHEKVSHSFDLGSMGILLFRNAPVPQHLVLNF